MWSLVGCAIAAVIRFFISRDNKRGGSWRCVRCRGGDYNLCSSVEAASTAAMIATVTTTSVFAAISAAIVCENKFAFMRHSVTAFSDVATTTAATGLNHVAHRLNAALQIDER